MKHIKFFAAIALMLLIVSVFSATVIATDSPVVTIESVSAEAGKAVTVSVSIENCPLIKSMAIMPIYDDDLLELHSGEWKISNALLSDNWSAETGDAVIAFSDPVDINGEIFEFSYSAKPEVSEGSCIPMSCSVVLVCDATNYQAIVIDGEFLIESKSSKITKADMHLDTDITINYYAELNDAHTGAQMKFTMSGIEKLVDGTPTGNGNEYVFPFRGVSPQCMGDNIKAELILDGEVLDCEDTYSVKEYCENTLAKTASELDMSAEKHAALQTLIKDMLVYGAKAQLYRGYKTDSLVDKDVTGSKFVELSSTDKFIDETSLEGVEIIGLGLYFDYTNSMYIRFTAPGMAEENFKIVFDGDIDNAYTLDDCMAVEGSQDTYLLVLPAVSLVNYDTIYTIEIGTFRASGRMIDGQYAEYSVASYIYSMQNRTEAEELTPMAQLARAVYNYGLAANAYAEIAD